MINQQGYYGSSEHVNFEQGVLRRTMELSQGHHPAFNIGPLRELVRMAHSMGYEVVRKSPGQLQAEGINQATQGAPNTTPSSAVAPPES